MISTPQTPSTWKQFCQGHSIPDLPYRSSQHEDRDSYTQRDVWVDAAQASSSTKTIVEVFTDVLAFQGQEAAITVAGGGYTTLTSRVVTADQPVSLRLEFSGTDDAAFYLYAEQLDQPLNLVIADQGPVSIELGKASENIGLHVQWSAGKASIKYINQYEPLERMSPERLKLTQTQLRIASILFWIAPDIAADLALHVARATTSSQIGSPLNIQANALAQQLSLTEVLGPNSNYAPSLTLDVYQKTFAGAIDVTDAFSRQFDAFTNRAAQVADQKAAWDTMLGHASDTLGVQTRLTSDALQKWTDARTALDDAASTLRADAVEMADKQMRFQRGIEDWKQQQEFEATVKILFAVFTFIVAIGALAVGDPAPAAAAPAAANNAVQGVTAAAQAAKTIEKIMSPENMKMLKDGLEGIGKLYDSALEIDKSLGTLNDPGAGMPVIGDEVSQSRDVSSLAQMAAWDKWTLESDLQMEFAVSHEIGGAAEYRLALQKHAIDGKLVTQCRAEATKAGHEYFQAKMALWVAQNDFARLKQLRATYQGEIETAQKAAEAFYDRKMSTITSVLIELRKAMWAYKYLSLSDSKVVLDPLKTIEDYKKDAQQLVEEVEGWRERLRSDFSPYTLPYLSSQLLTATVIPVVQQLQANGKADFTLALPQNVGPFDNATHVRTIGMRAYLIGAVSKESKTTAMGLKITSSGVYGDTQDGKIFTFVMRSDTRKFRYNMSDTISANSNDGDSLVTVDSFIPSQVFADPTPFTQWTIQIENPALYDLSKLSDVKLVWKGSMK